jgi:hypothetical protein
MTYFKTLVFAAAVAGAGFSVSQAGAMPLAAVAGASAPVEQVAWGCGPGWHPNPWGRCVPNRRFYGGYGVYGVYGGPSYGPRHWGPGPRPYWGGGPRPYRGW